MKHKDLATHNFSNDDLQALSELSDVSWGSWKTDTESDSETEKSIVKILTNFEKNLLMV